MIPLRRFAVAALLTASVALVPAAAAGAHGAWPPNPPPVKVRPHIACWQSGGFCWIPWVW